jgi:hypothetical protein
MIKICPHCGNEFECKTDDIFNCDCMKINLTKDAQVAIGKLYAECLCLDCLKKFNADPEKELIAGQKNKSQ